MIGSVACGQRMLGLDDEEGSPRRRVGGCIAAAAAAVGRSPEFATAFATQTLWHGSKLAGTVRTTGVELSSEIRGYLLPQGTKRDGQNTIRSSILRLGRRIGRTMARPPPHRTRRPGQRT